MSSRSDPGQPMASATDPSGRLALDLTECDREPIHIPGAIQPHGYLFVVSETDLRIASVSANVEDLLRQPLLRC